LAKEGDSPVDEKLRSLESIPRLEIVDKKSGKREMISCVSMWGKFGSSVV
jgi:hypothetical protein